MKIETKKEMEMTREKMERLLSDCTLCPRECHADRQSGRAGMCGQTAVLRAARAALHFWEEPCISGTSGCGAVFFSGCGVQCIYCQNRDIAAGHAGKELSIERLCEIFLELQEKGASCINLVTPTHFVPQILLALQEAKEGGLALPVVYNSSGYEKVDTLRLLEGSVDIFLPDFKYMWAQTGARFSSAPDYPERAKAALLEMVRQRGAPRMDDKTGILQSGVLVRHLVLPGHVKEAIEILAYLHGTYGSDIWISVMNQYTPLSGAEEYKELDRKVTKREYEAVLAAALEQGIEQGFFQEGDTAKESFIPAFSGEGI